MSSQILIYSLLLLMSDLERLGKALRELRTTRGITQDEVIERITAYSEASALGRVERGKQQPKRKNIVELVTKGLEERDPGKVDEFLILAGYEPLSDHEVSRLGLSRQDERPVRPNQQPEPTEVSAETARSPLARAWIILIAACVAASIPLGWLQGWFVWLCCILYSGLYAVSVLLEAAHEFRGRETVWMACVAGSLILPTSLGAMWLDSRFISMDRPEGLWIALFTFVLAAILQWVLVRPALPAYPIVPTKFQAHTAQSAHLKNSIYNLLIVFVFWVPTRHCLETLRQQASTGHRPVTHFCPKPVWLWVVLVLMVGAFVPARSYLLDQMKPSPRHNLYVNLFYIRALLFLLLSVLCLLWYSNSFVEIHP